MDQAHRTRQRRALGGAFVNRRTQRMVPRPPGSESDALAEVLSEMDAELAALEQCRDKTRALKQGMMQALLTGRVRLR